MPPAPCPDGGDRVVQPHLGRPAGWRPIVRTHRRPERDTPAPARPIRRPPPPAPGRDRQVRSSARTSLPGPRRAGAGTRRSGPADAGHPATSMPDRVIDIPSSTAVIRPPSSDHEPPRRRHRPRAPPRGPRPAADPRWCSRSACHRRIFNRRSSQEDLHPSERHRDHPRPRPARRPRAATSTLRRDPRPHRGAAVVLVDAAEAGAGVEPAAEWGRPDRRGTPRRRRRCS